MDKVPEQYRFIDFSDWARPLAIAIARQLLPLGIHPVVVTIAFLGLGIWAYFLILQSVYWLAGLLVLIKNVLDSVDGSLARLRGKPSLVGRYADSIADAILNTLWIYALYKICGNGWLAGTVWFFLHIEVTAMNYFFVIYRHLTGGDRTSKPLEFKRPKEGIAVPFWFLYVLYYGWQDLLIHVLVKVFPYLQRIAKDKNLLSILSLWGLGVHMLLLGLLLIIGKPCLFLPIELLGSVVWLVALFLIPLIKFRKA